MITFIPTPIGNPLDITLRAMRLFEEAELFLCEDTRETKRLMRLLVERYEMRSPEADFLSFNEHNGAQRLEEVAEKLRERKIVYVSDAGMPVISDPGQLLVAYCQEQNIPYDVLPGASAVVTAYAASGFEAGKFLFFGFLPHKGSERNRALNEALKTGYNTSLYEAPHRLMKLLEEVAAADPDREIFLAKELTKKFQTYYKKPAKALLEYFREMYIRGEWVVIIEAQKSERKALYLEDIMALDLAPKPKAKLLAKVTGESVKSCYERLIESRQ
ncbi:MAG TPA: 16S rRNA (cytidine(1402)-2'-O)-methyltransferase [Epsilonproteobacteria bacterium]|nr:16S rRNA (cytidine(1402)-2'-O)-methyltransferase [Campylobacterota bacterium]